MGDSERGVIRLEKLGQEIQSGEEIPKNESEIDEDNLQVSDA